MSKLFLFGAGSRGQQWIEKLGTDSVYAFIDNNASSVSKLIYEKYQKKVYSLEEVLKLVSDDSKIFITVSKQYRESAINDLIRFDLIKYIVCSPYPHDILKCGLNSDFNCKTEWAGNNYLGTNSSLMNSEIGFSSYIANETVLNCVKIGKFCCIGSSVAVFAGKHPVRDWVSMHPAFFSIDNPVTEIKFPKKQEFNERDLLSDGYSVCIGNDVWIGSYAKLKEGITIGDGAVIAAGSVVVKDVAPYSIVGGVPAKLIRYRFEPAQIDILLRYKWWNKDLDWIKENANKFKNIDNFLDFINEK